MLSGKDLKILRKRAGLTQPDLKEKLSKLLNFETIEFKTLEELKRWILKSPYKIDSWEDWTYLYKGKSSIEGEAMFNDLKVKIRKR